MRSIQAEFYTLPKATMHSAHIDTDDVRVAIESDTDIVTARRCGRAMAARLGFSPSDSTMVATAISELARNILLYAGRGEIVVRAIQHVQQTGLIVTARDEGGGIPNIAEAMRDGYSTSGRLGVGLPGVKRLMDEFDIASEVGKGTVVCVKKWRPLVW
jgi:serine/threonine-protein kinase RsbT